jgi:hypothetical protein
VAPARDRAAQTFSERGISLTVPDAWNVAGFSRSAFPARVAVASYSIPPDAVEGDCGGLEPVRAMPEDGALIILIDYGERRSGGFPLRPQQFRLADGQHAVYECFGDSWMFLPRTRPGVPGPCRVRRQSVVGVRACVDAQR